MFVTILSTLALALLSENEGSTTEGFGSRPYRSGGMRDFGVRGPTPAMRRPIPRDYEIEGQLIDLEAYGVLTGAGGIRGAPSFQTFSPAQANAMRRAQTEEGLRASSVAPPGF